MEKLKKLLLLVLLSLLFFSCEKENEVGFLVLSINVTGENISDGETSQMTVHVTPSDATNKDVVWSVSDPTIATISETGLVQYVTEGEITVTATALDGSGVSGSKVITISGSDGIPVESIVVTGENITDGTSSQMVATILPENASNKDIVWSLSNTDVATISESGLLTAVSNGSITVTATAEDGSETTGTKSISVSGVSGFLIKNEFYSVSNTIVFYKDFGLGWRHYINIVPSTIGYEEFDFFGTQYLLDGTGDLVEIEIDGLGDIDELPEGVYTYSDNDLTKFSVYFGFDSDPYIAENTYNIPKFDGINTLNISKSGDDFILNATLTLLTLDETLTIVETPLYIYYKGSVTLLKDTL